MNYYCHREVRPFINDIFLYPLEESKFIIVDDGIECFKLFKNGRKEKYGEYSTVKNNIKNGVYLEAPDDILEQFGIKTEMIKYYTDELGRPFVMGYSPFLIAYQGAKSWRVHKDMATPPCVHVVRDSNLKRGMFKLATPQILKEFGIENFIEDGYYGNSEFKPFVHNNSEFVLLRTEGNWETAMISGPDFAEPDAVKGSKMADEYDKDVMNGDFKKVEIQ